MTQRRYKYATDQLTVLSRSAIVFESSGAPLHTLSKLYDVPVGFVTPLVWGSALLYLRSQKGGCCLLDIVWLVLFLNVLLPLLCCCLALCEFSLCVGVFFCLKTDPDFFPSGQMQPKFLMWINPSSSIIMIPSCYSLVICVLCRYCITEISPSQNYWIEWRITLLFCLKSFKRVVAFN